MECLYWWWLWLHLKFLYLPLQIVSIRITSYFQGCHWLIFFFLTLRYLNISVVLQSILSLFAYFPSPPPKKVCPSVTSIAHTHWELCVRLSSKTLTHVNSFNPHDIPGDSTIITHSVGEKNEWQIQLSAWDATAFEQQGQNLDPGNFNPDLCDYTVSSRTQNNLQNLKHYTSWCLETRKKQKL